MRRPKLTCSKGAPECHRSSEFLEQIKVNIKPSVDIWSFGGVCSEAAVWVVLGKSGLMGYRNRRKQEICEKRTLQDGSCFHDGEKVLQTVEAMHDRLLNKGEVRPADHVTLPVLQMVDDMLEENPRDRPNAIQLCRKSVKILTKAQSKLQGSNQQTHLRHVDSTPPPTKTAQFVSGNMPMTPPPTSHGVVRPLSDGPPPRHNKSGSNHQPTGRTSSVKQVPMRRPDTGQEGSTILDMASGPVHGGPFNGSPPQRRATCQILETSPTVNNHPAFEEQPETDATAFHETATGHEAEGRQNFNPRSYSSPNGSRDITLESPSVLGQGTHGYSPPETELGTRVYLAQQLRSDARPAPAPLQNIGAFGSSSESNPQHSNVASTSTSYEEPHVMTGTTSGEASRRSPPKTPPLALIGNTTAAEPPVQKTNPVKPYLSYEDAKEIRERRHALSDQAQNSLNCLKVRDHVSSNLPELYSLRQ